jgi:hypothetical protein
MHPGASGVVPWRCFTGSPRACALPDGDVMRMIGSSDGLLRRELRRGGGEGAVSRTVVLSRFRALADSSMPPGIPDGDVSEVSGCRRQFRLTRSAYPRAEQDRRRRQLPCPECRERPSSYRRVQAVRYSCSGSEQPPAENPSLHPEKDFLHPNTVDRLYPRRNLSE